MVAVVAVVEEAAAVAIVVEVTAGPAITVIAALTHLFYCTLILITVTILVMSGWTEVKVKIMLLPTFSQHFSSFYS